MELHHSTELSEAAAPCEDYIDRLAVEPARRDALLARAGQAGAAGARPAMERLHRALAGEERDRAHPAYASIGRRLEHALRALPGARPPIARDRQGRVRLVTTPPLSRTSMAPGEWPLGRFVSRKEDEPDALPPASGRPWHRAGVLRRVLFLSLIIAQTAVAAYLMSAVLPYHGSQVLEMAVLGLFVVLFAWVSAGLWAAMMGFFLLLKGGDRFAISRTATPAGPIDDKARTAVVMPVCNEDVQRVFAGLRATYDSVAQTGQLKHFDFYVLSDTSDPDTRVAENVAWLELCRHIGDFGRVFYRRREHRIKKKSGNVADFCRRWGSNYRYMVILDADSVMSGACLGQLVRMMEANPNAGIIQTAPRASGRETLYARVQQFANRAYGPLFTAGLHYWQLGESHYWGHNAIIRVAPFIRHCALGRLPARGTEDIEILSHDFVEAALMRRAGWGVWIAYDLPGSYEEMPPNLIDELKRDRRWAQGNLINSRLFFAEGLHPAHRAVFMTGVMAYLSAPLWFLFLLLSTALLAVHTLVPPEYFVQPGQLFPLWPQWHLEWAMGLVTATAVLLFLPKLLSVMLIVATGAGGYGGSLKITASMMSELVLSALLAPVRMLFHTQFVIASLLGWKVHWRSPPREDAETAWVEALRRHGVHSLIGVAWAAGVYWLSPAYLWWLLPVVGALIVSIPLSVYSSRVSMGRWARAAGFFLMPEESRPPAELQRVAESMVRPAQLPGFVEAVVDPLTNAMICAAGMARLNEPAAVRAARERLVADALHHGPARLRDSQKNALLRDTFALSALHFQVWTSREAHAAWREAQTSRRGAQFIALAPGHAARKRSAAYAGREQSVQ
jgi:membrane glycosyltransferase